MDFFLCPSKAVETNKANRPSDPSDVSRPFSSFIMHFLCFGKALLSSLFEVFSLFRLMCQSYSFQANNFYFYITKVYT